MFEIKIVDLPPQPVMTIRCRTSLAGLPMKIGENYHMLMACLDEYHEQPVYAPYTAYFEMDMENLDVAMGFPVRQLLPARPPVLAEMIPAGSFAIVQYKGPYSGLSEVYQALTTWIREQNLVQIETPAGFYFEYYFNSPQEVPESELLTEIRIPVAKAT